jgi:hypothetical protein
MDELSTFFTKLRVFFRNISLNVGNEDVLNFKCGWTRVGAKAHPCSGYEEFCPLGYKTLQSTESPLTVSCPT